MNGHLIILTCISFFNELPFVFMGGGDIHDRDSFVILCRGDKNYHGCVSEKAIIEIAQYLPIFNGFFCLHQTDSFSLA